MLLVISAPSSPGVRSLRRPRAIHMENAAARLREYRLDDVSSEVKAAIDGGLICEHWVGIENRLSGGFFLPRSKSAMSGFGTNRTSSDVRSSGAIGGKPDVARIAQLGRD